MYKSDLYIAGRWNLPQLRTRDQNRIYGPGSYAIGRRREVEPARTVAVGRGNSRLPVPDHIENSSRFDAREAPHALFSKWLRLMVITPNFR